MDDERTAMRQGKCDACELRWVWFGAPALPKATCPQCGRNLTRTTYLGRNNWVSAYGETFGGKRKYLSELFAHAEMLGHDAASLEAETHWVERRAGGA